METTIKHACILTSYYRPKPGGFCKRYFRAIEALLNQGHEVHYLAVVRFPVDNVRCHFHRFPWPEDRTDSLFFWAVFQLLAPVMLLYLGMRYKATHAFAFGPTYAFLLQPVRMIRKIPLTLFLRADTIENHQIKGTRSWIVWIEMLIEGLAINKARLYGVSEVLTKKVVERHSFLSPLKYGTFRNNVKTHQKMLDINPRSPLRLGCVGILEKRKNQELLIRCMRNINRGDVELLLFGVGSEEMYLKGLVKDASLEDQVRFMGWVDSDEIWPGIDLLLMPSLHEGAPNSILEAMALGLPFLASKIPEHEEIVSIESLIEINDEKLWSNAINKILANPKQNLASLQQASMRDAEKLIFDWEEKIYGLITVVLLVE